MGKLFMRVWKYVCGSLSGVSLNLGPISIDFRKCPA